MFKELTALGILLRVQINTFGLPEKNDDSCEKDEFAMLSENYLKYAE